MTRHWCRIDKSINVRRECAYEFVRSLEMTKAHTPVATACIRMQRTVRYMRGFFIIESEIESERWADVQRGRVYVCGWPDEWAERRVERRGEIPLDVGSMCVCKFA